MKRSLVAISAVTLTVTPVGLLLLHASKASPATTTPNAFPSQTGCVRADLAAARSRHAIEVTHDVGTWKVAA